MIGSIRFFWDCFHITKRCDPGYTGEIACASQTSVEAQQQACGSQDEVDHGGEELT